MNLLINNPVPPFLHPFIHPRRLYLPYPIPSVSFTPPLWFLGFIPLLSFSIIPPSFLPSFHLVSIYASAAESGLFLDASVIPLLKCSHSRLIPNS